MALTGEHLAEGIRDVDDPGGSYVGGVHFGGGQRGVYDLFGEVGEIQFLSAQVASEIALIAAENPHVVLHSRTLLQTERRTC